MMMMINAYDLHDTLSGTDFSGGKPHFFYYQTYNESYRDTHVCVNDFIGDLRTLTNKLYVLVTAIVVKTKAHFGLL